MRLQSPGRILRVFLQRGRSGQPGAIELLVEPRSAAVDRSGSVMSSSTSATSSLPAEGWRILLNGRAAFR
jgi:hypothetical protein